MAQVNLIQKLLESPEIPIRYILCSSLCLCFKETTDHICKQDENSSLLWQKSNPGVVLLPLGQPFLCFTIYLVLEATR